MILKSGDQAAGILKMYALEAKINHDHDWIGKMDPYLLVISSTGKRFKTETAQEGGKSPIWN